MPQEQLTPDSAPPASYFACVRLVADEVDAQTIVTGISRGPLHRLGVVKSALYLPAEESQVGGNESLQLVGHFCVPSVDPAPRTLALGVKHPACRAFHLQEIVDWPIAQIAHEFPLMSNYCDQLQSLGLDLNSCRLLALPIAYEAVTHGVLTLLVTNAPHSWTLADAELLRGAASLVAVWLRLTLATNLIQASGILEPRKPGRNIRLSERQLTILRALREGKSNTFIAASLGFSISTVKQDIRALQVMLGARNRREVVKRAVEVGLLTSH